MKFTKILSCFLLFFFTANCLQAEIQSGKESSVRIDAKKKKKKKDKIKYQPSKFKESKLAHQLLDGKRGLEIGASIHNPFGLNTLNVDYTDDYTTVFKQEEIRKFGKCQKVDIVSAGDELPFKDDVWDFVISSHVIEHFYDPIKTVKEWLRVVKPGGYVYIIAPHKERTFDKNRDRTTLAEIIQNHDFPNPPEPDHHGHYSVWITQDFVDICNHYEWPVVAVQDTDDKVGNGFTIVIQKPSAILEEVPEETLSETEESQIEPELDSESPVENPLPEENGVEEERVENGVEQTEPEIEVEQPAPETEVEPAEAITQEASIDDVSLEAIE